MEIIKKNIIVKTKEGDFEIGDYNIGTLIQILKDSENATNMYDVSIKKIQKVLVGKYKTTDIWNYKGSVLTKLMTAITKLESFSGEIIDNDSETISVIYNGEEYKFEEKQIKDLRQSGAQTKSEVEILNKQIRLSMISPEMSEEEFNNLPACLYEGFSIAIKKLYYDSIDLGN